jgi:integrase/recombinase XerD
MYEHEMTILDLYKDFIFRKLAEDAKDSTITWYEVRLRRFLKRFGDMPVNSLKLRDVENYIVSLRDEDISDSYRYALVRVVRTVLKWGYEWKHIEDDIYRWMKLPKIPKQTPKAIDKEDLIKLLKSCDGSNAGVRDKALMLFLIDTGCRVGGLCNLTKRELNLESRRAILFEKGDRSRVVLFRPETKAALESWIDRNPWVENKFVFTSLSKDLPMNRNSVIQMLRRRGEKAGVKGRVNPHSFRHAFAREYLLNGGDLATVSEILGHSKLAVTKDFYAIFGIEELRKKHDSFSPLSNIDFQNLEL